ncbi:MAG: WecB/TagA/CpsF family glycosyltransferase [Nannocystaceae bacterium]|nr:WecB/TagA/CpsF family glycosyltransferase [Nannocystaceae bacterium]
MTARVNLFGAEFDPLSLQDTIERIEDHVRAGRQGWLCTVNVAILMMMRNDPWLESFISRASIVVADGQPLMWCSKVMLPQPLPERVAGVDLVFALAKQSEQTGLRIGVLGAKAEVIEELASRIRTRHPDAKLVYVGDGFFDADGAKQRAADIKAANVEVLLVGMGVPRQEHFVDEQFEAMGIPLCVGVGGSFDVLAGVVSRAPEIVQRAGMEWAFRLAQEPQRLWKRYLVTNATFIWHAGRKYLRGRGTPPRT